MAFQLLKGLRTIPDLDLFVIVLNKGRLWEAVDKSGIPVWVIEENRLSFPEIIRAASGIVTKTSPHIIHSHRYKENFISFILSLRLHGHVSLVSTMHGMPECYGDTPKLIQRLKIGLNLRLLSLWFEKTVCVSRDIKNILRTERGFAEGSVQMIHNGVEIPKVAPRDVKARTGFVIGSAARFSAVKDLSLMVEVAREVAEKQNEIRFVLAGEGPMLPEIQALIRRYGLENRFVLNGFVEDMQAFYRTLDAYMNTSLHEGIPMSVLEAMASGLPVILPRLGGLREIVIDGIDGFLVDGRNPRDFAAKCLLLYDDQELQGKMAKAATEKIINEFSTEQMVRKYFHLYRNLTTSSG